MIQIWILMLMVSIRFSGAVPSKSILYRKCDNMNKQSLFMNNRGKNEMTENERIWTTSFERLRLYLLQFKSPEYRKSTATYFITGIGELRQSVVDSFRIGTNGTSGRYFAFEVLFTIIALFGCPSVVQLLLHSLATIIQLSGTVISILSVWTIRKSFSLFEEAPRNLNDFVRTGPYQFVRHPFYSGILMYLLGAAIRSRDIYRLLGAGFLAAILNKKASEEEILLVEKFGSDYVMYTRNKKKFIPKLF